MADMIGPVSKCSDFVIRIRGIPWSCSKDEIVEFFNGEQVYFGPFHEVSLTLLSLRLYCKKWH